MKTIIAGSRNITDFSLLKQVIIHSKFIITEVVCGGAKGVDSLGKFWGDNIGKVPVKLFLAQWNIFGKSAGYKRNVEMANYAEAAILIWDGFSKGTQHMIDIAFKKDMIIYIYYINTNSFYSNFMNKE